MRQTRTRDRSRLGPVVGVLGIVAVLLLPSGATATEPFEPRAGGTEPLPPHAFGLYTDGDQRGMVSGHLTAVPDLSEVTYPGTDVSPQGAARSVWNRGLYRWCLYSGPEYTGVSGWVPPGMTAGLPHEAGDSAAAVRPVAGERC